MPLETEQASDIVERRLWVLSYSLLLAPVFLLSVIGIVSSARRALRVRDGCMAALRLAGCLSQRILALVNGRSPLSVVELMRTRGVSCTSRQEERYWSFTK